MVGDIWEVRIYCAANAQVALNVYHFLETATAGAGGSEADAASAFDTLAAPVYKPAMAGAAEYSGTQAQRIKPTRTVARTSNIAGGSGTGAGDLLPLEVSGIISTVTAKTGRGFRGRIYVPFPYADANNAAGEPTAAYAVVLGAIAAAFLATHTIGAGGNTSTIVPVIYHRKTATTDPVTGFLAKVKWAGQHRRGDYGRPNVLPFA